MLKTALKDNQNSKVGGHANGGGITRSACRAKFPEAVKSPEHVKKAMGWLESVFPKRIKIETVDGVARLVLTSPRSVDCEKLDDVLKLIGQAITEGKEPVLPISKLVGTSLFQKPSSLMKPTTPTSSLSELPTRRHERNWRKASATVSGK